MFVTRGGDGDDWRSLSRLLLRRPRLELRLRRLLDERPRPFLSEEEPSAESSVALGVFFFFRDSLLDERDFERDDRPFFASLGAGSPSALVEAERERDFLGASLLLPDGDTEREEAFFFVFCFLLGEGDDALEPLLLVDFLLAERPRLVLRERVLERPRERDRDLLLPADALGSLERDRAFSLVFEEEDRERDRERDLLAPPIFFPFVGDDAFDVFEPAERERERDLLLEDLPPTAGDLVFFADADRERCLLLVLPPALVFDRERERDLLFEAVFLDVRDFERVRDLLLEPVFLLLAEPERERERDLLLDADRDLLIDPAFLGLLERERERDLLLVLLERERDRDLLLVLERPRLFERLRLLDRFGLACDMVCISRSSWWPAMCSALRSSET